MNQFIVPVLFFAAIVLCIVLFRLLRQYPVTSSVDQSILAARGYLSLGNLNEALCNCNWAAEMDPKNAEAHWILGRLDVEKAELDLAGDEFRLCTELEASNAAYWRDLGLVLLLSPDLNETLFDEIAMAFRRASLLEPLDWRNRLHALLIQVLLGYSTELEDE